VKPTALAALTLLLAVQLMSSCRTEHDTSTQDSEATTSQQRASVTPAAALPEPPGDLEPEQPSAKHPHGGGPAVEHLLKPFELFAPKVILQEHGKKGRKLPVGLDPCNRDALGESVRQHPLIYGPPQAHGEIYRPGLEQGEIRSEFFEGIAGAGISPNCPRISPYGPRKTHAYTFAYFSQLTERTPERLATWNDLPGVMEFETEARMQDGHLKMELRAQPAARTGHTYWLDHCVGMDSVIFSPRSRYYYFNPEPVEIQFDPEVAEPPRRVNIVLNPEVDSWWDDLKVQGKAEPYLLVHQPEGALNILLYWQDAAVLKVQRGQCIHVNPAIISNGKPQTLVGELYLFRAQLRDALAFGRSRVAR